MSFKAFVSPCPLPNRICGRVASRVRSGSTASSSHALPQFPFPSHPRPAPHQIFHLARGASQKEIKARYYDLVRYHHPDSPHCRSLEPAERHARFQAITHAYDVLREKSSGFPERDPYREEVRRRKQHYEAHRARRAPFVHPEKEEWTASADDRWKDRVILVVSILTLVAGLAPGLFLLPHQYDRQHLSAVMNLSQARSEAREFGEERRTQVRRRAQEIKLSNEEKHDGKNES